MSMKSKIDSREKAKHDREEVVRRHAARQNRRSGIVKITVANVYGDAYRVNYYAENAGVENAITTLRLVDSEFLRMKVELPAEKAHEVVAVKE